MDISLPFQTVFFCGMTSMTAGLGGLQTPASLRSRGDVPAHGHASRPQTTHGPG